MKPLFPKAPDQHKPNNPMVPNGLGVFYVLISVIYLFLAYFELPAPSGSVSAPLILAVCILFGGFLGLLDDWIDLKWRYKAFLPLIAAIPLVAFVASATYLPYRTAVSIPFLFSIDFGQYYYFVVIPILVMIVTNTVNMLGGLNGLETVCPAIVLVGLTLVSGSNAVLMLGPLAAWIALAVMNVQGRIFVGNTGSFSIGMTLAAFAIISNLKLGLIISLIPYIVNSAIILLTFFFLRVKAHASYDGRKISSDHRRSLVTLITYRRPLTERKIVLAISIVIAVTTAIAILIQAMATP